MQPSQLGPYTIVTRLGRGGMGAVYEATDEFGHHVAVKVLAAHLADEPALRRRFDSEIATLKSLRHPGIVQLLAFGEEEDQPYFAMDLVRGQSLEHMLRTGRRFTWRETVTIALAITRALKAAHDHGVVHRDLKPANLLVADGPDADLGGRVRLADFGIAKLFGGASHTAHGNVVGTAEYMAPEQAAGGHVDHRVDLYALGLVMFAMLAGKPPFGSAPPAEIIRRQQHQPPPRISTLVTDVPRELDELIDRLLMKEPAKRPANALALARLLTAIDALHPDTPPVELDGPLTELPLPPPGDAADPAIDLFAPTQAVTARNKDATELTRTRAATGALPGNTTKQASPNAVTGGANPAATTVVERTPRSRFTTVAELDRLASKRASRSRANERMLQIVAVLVTGALFAAAGYMIFRKPTVDEVFNRIETVRTSVPNGGDLRDAVSSIDEFLARFSDDPRAGQVRGLKRALDLDALEKRSRRRLLGDARPTPVERDYRAAMDREAESPSACRDALAALIAVHASAATPPTDPSARLQDDPTLWIDLARRQLERVGPLSEREQEEDARRLDEMFRKAADLADRANRLGGDAQANVLELRREVLQSIVKLYGTRPHAADAVATAKKLLAE